MKLSHVEGAILAGGKSSRMGRDRAAVTWQGASGVERVATLLGSCLERVRIVLPPDAPNPTSLPRIDDTRGPRAAIVGLEAALSACEASAVLVAACDMPELEPRLLLALLALAPAEGGAEVVMPVTVRGPVPLLAIYRPRILPEVRRRIAVGELSLQHLLDCVQTQPVPESLLRQLDPELRSFRNLNRPEEIPPGGEDRGD